MSYGLVSHVSAGATGDTLTGNIVTTGSKLLVASLHGNLANVTSFVDFFSNTWVPLTKRDSLSANSLQMYYCLNPIVGSGHWFKANGAGSFVDVCVSAWSGAKSSGVLFAETGGSNDATQPGSITPPVPGCLIIACDCWTSNAGPEVANSGFGIVEAQVFSGGSHYGGCMWSLIQNPAAAVNPTFSGAGAVNRAVGMACFLPGAAVPITGKPWLRSGIGVGV